MASKKDVYNAFYEGVCTVLMGSIDAGGINPVELDVDIDELKDFCLENEHYMPVYEWIMEG